MSGKVFLLSGVVCVTGILLAGCQSTTQATSEAKTAKVGKVVAKQAVKAAVRHSPVAVLKAVK